jgi:hypothetical protein
MFHFLKYFLLTLLFTLVACNDQQSHSSTEPLTTNQVEPTLPAKLRLDIPSLLGWGEISEIKMTIGDSIEFIATIETEEGESLPNEALFIESEKGNFLTENVLLTDHNGQATSLLLATIPGTDQIILKNKGNLSTSLSVTVLDPDGEWNQDEQGAYELKELAGVVSWKILAKVSIKNGQPAFDPEIQALNGQEVKVQGFMLPLEQTEKQEHFLLSVNPPSCFFCLPAGSEGIVEVYIKPGIEFSDDPIIVMGKLTILKNDEMGLYYRMQNAQPVTF